ncbi:unnamed protein product [Mytilus edulis]|uniref:Reverse transcriptase domain-containing protein n=1 Tax=Mytilus edulis TaxID=6550 RepID=A0A8S3R2L1_MYTED|nr:unnamed protein product [Mytilus edulis]
MSDENSEPSIEHNQYQSDSETDSNIQSLSSESLLSDGFLEDNEIVGLTEFDLGDVNSPDNTANFEPEINVLLAEASPITSTPQPLNVTEIPTESVDIPIKIQTTSTMSKLVRCREFSGYPQDNAKGFFSEFESYALLHELPETDKRRIAAFHLHLKGPALTWYNSLSDESKSSWITICVLFKEKYINFSWQSATVIMESEIFQNMVLSPGQSLEDYFSQLSEKAQILRKHDHELVAKFISGLPEKMSFFVRAGQPVDAHHALTSAKMAEACGYRQHGDSINALKHENKHAPRQLPGKSNIIDSNQSEVIRDLQNQVAILTDLVQGKHKEHVQSEPSHSDVHDIRDQIGQLSGLITSMAVEVPNKEPKRPENTSTNYANTSRFDSAEWKQDQPGCGAQSSGLTSSIGADFDENATKDKFLYITVLFGDLRIAALVDTGSSINVISKSLYDSISDRHKLYFEQLSESEIRLANNDKIRINGISKLQATIHQKNEIIETYIIPKTSHPLILGTEYLRENKIVLDFSDFSCNQRTVPVKTGKRIELEPNTEYLTFGKLPNYVTVGLQGICVNSKFSVNHKFLVAKSLVVVPVNRKVPIKLLNASNVKITIPKGKNIAEFSTLSNEYTYVAMSEKSEIPEVQNIQLVANENGLRTDISEQQCDITDSPDRQEILTKIKTDFDLSDHLTHDQKSELAECLFDNLDLFVTKENPNLGYTHLVEHKIHLKPNAVGKHHKPYRLPPYKREVLREQLDNLLEQGIVVPVSEQEELPITSPIVLVTKRNEASNSKTSTQSYRFVCDFRHLNAQTEDFKYVIPNLQELTESFAEIVPNYITSIDLSSGFFQMGISAESSRYTAFNTCFGTYKFLRLPMGLKTAPNTFQLLMDKVLRGLKFRTCLCYLDDVLICSETFEKHLDDIKRNL